MPNSTHSGHELLMGRDLAPFGAPRLDWGSTLLSTGWETRIPSLESLTPTRFDSQEEPPKFICTLAVVNCGKFPESRQPRVGKRIPLFAHRCRREEALKCLAKFFTPKLQNLPTVRVVGMGVHLVTTTHDVIMECPQVTAEIVRDVDGSAPAREGPRVSHEHSRL